MRASERRHSNARLHTSGDRRRARVLLVGYILKTGDSSTKNGLDDLIRIHDVARDARCHSDIVPGTDHGTVGLAINFCVRDTDV